MFSVKTSLLSLVRAVCFSLFFMLSFSVPPSLAVPAPSWSYELDPQVFLYADVRSSSRVVNLMKFSPNTYKMDQSLYPQADAGFDGQQDSLTLDNFKNGLMVYKEKGIEAGPGFAQSWKFSFPTLPALIDKFSVSVGLAPIVGKSVFTEQIATDLESIKELPRIGKIPRHRSDFEQWKVGDAVTVNTSGGIVFFAGISQFPFSLKVLRMAKGTWTQHVRKISDHEVFVRLTKDQLSSLSEVISGTVVSLRLTQFHGEDRNFSFKLDLSNPDGWAAYKDLMFGNLAGVQHFVAENQFNGFVEYVDQTNGQYAGHIVSWKFGIPILINETNTFAEIEREETILTPKTGETTTVNYGVSITQKTVRHLLKSFNKRNVFWAGQFDKQDASGKSMSQGVLGEFSWGFEGKGLESGDLEKVIHRLIMTTGLYSPLKLNLPEVKNLGSATLDLKLRIPPSGIASLIKNIGKASKAQFRQVALEYCKSISQAQTDDDDKDDVLEEGSSVCVMNRDNTKTFKAIDKMWNEIQLVYNHAQTGKLNKDQLIALARFGKAMSTSAVTFQTALGMMGEYVYLDYQINGNRLNQYHVRFMRNSDAKFINVDKPEGSVWDSRTSSDDFTLPRNGTMITVPRNLPFPKTGPT